jgi:hypothetical protein
MTTVVPIQYQDTAETSTTTATPTTTAAVTQLATTATAATAMEAVVQIDWTAVGYAVDGGGNDSGDTVLMVSRRSSVKRSKLQRYTSIHMQMYAYCMSTLLCIVLHSVGSALVRTLQHAA